MGEPKKKKNYLLKSKLNKEISTFRDILVSMDIPHTPIPLGYCHHVDAKLAWLRWENSSMKLRKTGKIEAYINFHRQRHTTTTHHPTQPTPTHPDMTDPPPEEKTPYTQP
jgi:hypothetical protein